MTPPSPSQKLAVKKFSDLKASTAILEGYQITHLVSDIKQILAQDKLSLAVLAPAGETKSAADMDAALNAEKARLHGIAADHGLNKFAAASEKLTPSEVERRATVIAAHIADSDFTEKKKTENLETLETARIDNHLFSGRAEFTALSARLSKEDIPTESEIIENLHAERTLREYFNKAGVHLSLQGKPKVADSAMAATLDVGIGRMHTIAAASDLKSFKEGKTYLSPDEVEQGAERIRNHIDASLFDEADKAKYLANTEAARVDRHVASARIDYSNLIKRQMPSSRPTGGEARQVLKMRDNLFRHFDLAKIGVSLREKPETDDEKLVTLIRQKVDDLTNGPPKGSAPMPYTRTA
jgi:hypothetical protein